eukprot:9360507-Alexandrium_andersonii.AAC.1
MQRRRSSEPGLAPGVGRVPAADQGRGPRADRPGMGVPEDELRSPEILVETLMGKPDPSALVLLELHLHECTAGCESAGHRL